MTRRRVAALSSLALAAGLLMGVAPSAPVVTASAADSCEPGTVTLTPQIPPALDMLSAEAAHRVATGRGVIVAVVDSGIDAANPHLADAVIGGVNLVGDGERPDGLSDVHGHGTIIAGQIAAQPVPGSGVTGVAPDARLLSVRVFRSESDQDVKKGYGPAPERLADGIRWAADNGAHVINVSLSYQGDSPELREAVEHAAAAGALVVASAGNRASAPDAPDAARFPAGYAEVLGVTAGDRSGRADDSSIHGPQVDVTAPGMDVLSTAAGAGDCTYATESASASFATGYASGVAALLAEAHPAEGGRGWLYRLTATALRDDPDHRTDLDGWGLIQPLDALQLLPDASTRGPESPFFDTTDSAVRPASAEVTANDDVSPFAVTRETLVLVAVLATATLGVLSTMLVLRRRRAEETSTEAQGASRTGGMLDRPEEG